MPENRAPDGWTPDNSVSGKESDVPAPPCVDCGQPTFYMFGVTAGVFKMHKSTGQFLCPEYPSVTDKKENNTDGA
jgi:hypothetical protein